MEIRYENNHQPYSDICYADLVWEVWVDEERVISIVKLYDRTYFEVIPEPDINNPNGENQTKWYSLFEPMFIKKYPSLQKVKNEINQILNNK